MTAVLVVFAVGYLAVVAIVFVAQRKMQYFPDTTRRTPEEVGAVGFSEIDLKAGTGETLVAWYKPATAGRPTILFFHGNGGSISTRPRKLMAYAQTFGVLAADYRGYGGNSGSPSESGLMEDATRAYDWLVAQGVKPSDILLLGESLGTGVAVQIAAAKPVRAMALEAPYASTVDIGAAHYWYLPVHLLMKDQYRSSDYIGQVKVPQFVIHGTDDRTVPFAQGRKLFGLANEPKQFVEMRERGHDIIGDAETWAKVIAFFEAQTR
jgi:pimeloyl-ACP methyl ester carboxylesterase